MGRQAEINQYKVSLSSFFFFLCCNGLCSTTCWSEEEEEEEEAEACKIRKSVCAKMVYADAGRN